jgi:hypothetical protein
MDDTAIALFVYNRPEHTSAVLNGLRRNGIEKLYVFADGPATEADWESVEAVRAVVQSVDWCDVTLIERRENKGLAASVRDGYEYLFERYPKLIMLEDDCVPTPDFVDYMTTCLDAYEDDDRVMNVHGYSPPIDVPAEYPYDVYFTYRSGSWGQGIWRDAWANFKESQERFLDLISSHAGRKRLDRAGKDLYSMIDDDIENEADSIGVWWSLSLVAHDGLSVNPVRSRVENIGFDGSGVHGADTDKFDVDVSESSFSRPLRLPKDPSVDATINRRYVEFMGSGKMDVLDKFKIVTKYCRQTLPWV